MDKKALYNKLRAVGYTPAGACGLMGNLMYESGLRANNLENIGNNALDMSDEDYCNKVSDGVISCEEFSHDGYGIGLAQWTYHSRKKWLWNNTVKVGKRIDDEDAQVEYLVREISGYPSVDKCLKTTDSVREASDIVLIRFEKPYDQSESMQIKRATIGEEFYKELTYSAYYPECSYRGTQFTAALASIGEANRYEDRQKIAAANDMPDYLGLGAQNLMLCRLLQAGLLKKPKK